MSLKKIILGSFALMLLGMGAASASPSPRQPGFSEPEEMSQQAPHKKRRFTKSAAMVDLKEGFYYEGRTIELVYFNKMDDNIPSEKIDLEGSLKEFVERESPIGMDDEDRFESEIFRLAGSMGYGPDRISSLKPAEAVMLAAKVIKKQISYNYLCWPRDRVCYGTEEGFYKRKGVCSDYTDLVIKAFDVLKKHNNGLDNVYVLSAELPDHYFNEVIFVHPRKVQIAYIDVTWWDGGGRLEAMDYEHIDPRTWKIDFFRRARDCESADEEGKGLLEIARNRKDRTRINEIIAEACKQTNSSDDKLKALEAYKRLVDDSRGSKEEWFFPMCQIASWHFSAGDYGTTIKVLDEIAKKFPNSKNRWEYKNILADINTAFGKKEAEAGNYYSALDYFLKAIIAADGGYRSSEAKGFLRAMANEYYIFKRSGGRIIEKYDLSEEEKKYLQNRTDVLMENIEKKIDQNKKLKRYIRALVFSLAGTAGIAHHFRKKYLALAENSSKSPVRTYQAREAD